MGGTLVTSPTTSAPLEAQKDLLHVRAEEVADGVASYGAYVTVSVPFMPACSWPGTVQ